MKQKGKKVVGLVACSMLFALSAISLAACGGEQHDLKEYSEKAATCTEAGYKHHYECSDCGKYYEDADAKKEISESEVVIPAKGHKPTERKAADPSCFEVGYSVDHWYCANGCGTIWSDNGTTVMTDTDGLVLPATEHKGTIHHVNAKPAGIGTEGNVEHWHCDLCGKNYKNQFGDNELTDVSIPATEEVSMEVTVNLYNAVGEKITAPQDLEFVVSNTGHKYAPANVKDGVLSLNKIAKGTWTVSAQGYIPATFTVDEPGKATVNMIEEYATISATDNDTKVTFLTVNGDTAYKAVTFDSTDGWYPDQLESGKGQKKDVKLKLTDEQIKAPYLTFDVTVKLLKNPTKNAVDRFGIKVTTNGTKSGFVYYCQGNANADATQPELGYMAGNFPELKLGPEQSIVPDEAFRGKDGYEKVSTDGFKLRIERSLATVTLKYFNGTDYVTLYTFENLLTDNNDIQFTGVNGVWEFSEMSVTASGTKTVVPHKAPESGVDGNIKYVTVSESGTTKYYLPDGTEITLEDTVLSLTEKNYVVSVKAYDYDGTAVDPIAANTAVKLTMTDGAGATYNTTVTAAGKLARTSFSTGTYVVEIDGFANGRLVVGDDEAQGELIVYKPFATNSNEAGQSTVKEETYQTAADSVDRKITLSSNGDGVTPIYENRAEVKISLSATEQTAKNITVSGKLKFTGANDHLARAGMTMTEGWHGFVLYHASNRIDRHPGEYKLDQTDQLGSISYDELTAGIEFRMVRTGTAIMLYIKNANGWVLRASVSCAEDAANDIRFAGGLGTWEYTELAVTVPTYAKHDYVAPTASAAGMLPYYTLANGSVTENYMMNGVWIASLDGLALPQLGENVAITVANQFNSASTEGNANITGNTAVITKNKWADDSNTITLTPESGVGTDFVLNFNVKIEGNLTGATERMAFSLSTTGDVYRIYNLGGWKIGHGQRMDDNNKWLDQDKGEALASYGDSIRAAITSTDGLNLSLIRQGNTVTVLAQLGGEWVKLDSFAVSGDAEFKLHYGGDFDGNQTWTFSDITLNTLAAQD